MKRRAGVRPPTSSGEKESSRRAGNTYRSVHRPPLTFSPLLLVAEPEGLLGAMLMKRSSIEKGKDVRGEEGRDCCASQVHRSAFELGRRSAGAEFQELGLQPIRRRQQQHQRLRPTTDRPLRFDLPSPSSQLSRTGPHAFSRAGQPARAWTRSDPSVSRPVLH